MSSATAAANRAFALVHVFRTLENANASAQRLKACAALVLGRGLLGPEAASGLRHLNSNI
jgi:NAD(P)H-nitrite reductase large subunit